VFHFEGAALDLPRDQNYMFEDQVQDAGGNFTCLAVNAADDMTIIGNYEQQNLPARDLRPGSGNMLSFIPAQCSKL
jgi:hypothetical protein